MGASSRVPDGCLNAVLLVTGLIYRHFPAQPALDVPRLERSRRQANSLLHAYGRTKVVKMQNARTSQTNRWSAKPACWTWVRPSGGAVQKPNRCIVVAVTERLVCPPASHHRPATSSGPCTPAYDARGQSTAGASRGSLMECKRYEYSLTAAAAADKAKN